MSAAQSERSRVDLDERFREAGLVVFERGWLSSNNVLFVGDAGVPATLVDSGYWTHQEQTEALLRRALGPERQLGRLVNTHLHSDHCGGNERLQRLHSCVVDVPAGEFDKVQRWDERELTYEATGQHCPRFEPQGRLHPGETVRLGGRAWNVVASPGHDPESVMFHDPALGILISADALWEDGFGVVFPELEGLEAFAAVGRTLELISGLNVDLVIPGHGRPFSGVYPALERARGRLARFVADPRKHALHAAKVLIKFHLLEVQAESRADLDVWLQSTRYFNAVHSEHFGSEPWTAWRTHLLEGLLRSRAIELDGDFVRNL